MPGFLRQLMPAPALSLLVVGCSSGPIPASVARLDDPSPSGPAAAIDPRDAYPAYAGCMRENGVEMADHSLSWKRGPSLATRSVVHPATRMPSRQPTKAAVATSPVSYPTARRRASRQISRIAPSDLHNACATTGSICLTLSLVDKPAGMKTHRATRSLTPTTTALARHRMPV